MCDLEKEIEFYFKMPPKETRNVIIRIIDDCSKENLDTDLDKLINENFWDLV